MDDASDEQAAERDVDHLLGDVETALVVAHEATIAGEPPEGAFDHPAARDDLEAELAVGPPDDLDDEVEEGSLVEQVAAVIGAVGEEVLDLRPALADRRQDRLRPPYCRRCPPWSG